LQICHCEAIDVRSHLNISGTGTIVSRQGGWVNHEEMGREENLTLGEWAFMPIERAAAARGKGEARPGEGEEGPCESQNVVVESPKTPEKAAYRNGEASFRKERRSRNVWNGRKKSEPLTTTE